MTVTQIIPIIYSYNEEASIIGMIFGKLKIIKTIKHPLIFFSLDNQHVNVKRGTILFDIFSGSM